MIHTRLESQLFKKGHKLIAGIDESGRGPLAGPVFAAAVIFPKNVHIKGLDDSKKLSPAQREKLFIVIKKKALHVACCAVSEKTIDKINILNASLLAMKKAVRALKKIPCYILVDGNRAISDMEIPQKQIIGGDGISASIAAASIIAKVSRDRYMNFLHVRMPEYGFQRHKGYGTKEHVAAIKKHGASSVHRMSFLASLSN